MKYEFKPYDKVLVRDTENNRWLASFYSHYREDNINEYNYVTVDGVGYRCCIPYEGNEHLVGTTNSPSEPKQPTTEHTLHGIELKPGYVLEFSRYNFGVLFPMKRIDFPDRVELGISFACGGFDLYEDINTEDVVAIRGLLSEGNLTSGEVLWERPKSQVFTKAQIAEARFE